MSAGVSPDPVDDSSSRGAKAWLWNGATALVARVPVAIPLAVVFVLLFVFSSNWGHANWRIGGARSLFVLTLLCGTWWTSRSGWIGRGHAVSQWKESPLSGWEIAWSGLFLLTTLANLDQWPNIGVGLWFVGMASLLFVLIHDAISNGRIRLDQLADGLLLGAFGPLLWGILESLSTGSRAAGLTEHPNLYGGMAAWTIPIALARGARSEAFRRWPYWGISLIAAGGLFLSGSRGALIGLIGASAVLVPRRYLLAGAVVAAPVVALGIAARWASVLSRLPIYEAAFEGIRDRPWLGHGLFTFRFREGTLVQFHPHNVALQVAYDLGLVGLVMAIAQAARFARVIARNDAPERRGWIAALLATSLHQLVDVTWMSPGMLAMLLVLLAAATASPSAPPRRDSRLATWMFAGLTLVLLLSGWIVGNVAPAFFDMPPAPVRSPPDILPP